MASRYALAIVVACVLAYVVIGSAIARRQSATSDEVAHVAAGVGYAHGDMRLNREHPPLVKWLAGVALALRDPPKVPAHVDATTQWSMGHAILHRGAPGEALQLLARARMPVVWLAALCPLLVAWLALRMGGPIAAAAAAVCAACSPLWYAHGTLVTTDAALSLFTLAAALCIHGSLLQPDATPPRRWPWLAGLCASVMLGVASKYSMLVSVGGLGLAAGLVALANRKPRGVLAVWIALVVATLAAASLAWGLPPSLSAYLEGVRHVGGNHQPDYPFYAFGEHFFGVGGRPLYFVLALLVKVEWPVLLLSILGITQLVVRAAYAGADQETRQRALADLALLVVPAAVCVAVMSLRAPPIGVRYVLPALPFMFVAAGVAVSRLVASLSGRVAVAAALALELLALVQALQTSPLAWFNGFPCRTGQTPACLDDSNVDWGHALPALAELRDRRFDGASLRAFFFVQAPLGAYLPHATPAEPLELVHPYRAVYAASLHSLARMPQASPFSRASPTAVVAGAIAIFDLRPVVELPDAPP